MVEGCFLDNEIDEIKFIRDKLQQNSKGYTSQQGQGDTSGDPQNLYKQSQVSDDSRKGIDIKQFERKVAPKALLWENLHYTVKTWRFKRGKVAVQSKSRTILNYVSGYAAPGQILGILGPSGSGKTTLLNALAGRLPAFGGSLTGDITINNVQRDKSFRKYTSYVLQDDVFYETRTVYETLVMGALLRRQSGLSQAEKIQNVDHVIAELGLNKCRNSQIGSSEYPGSISGGERRRVSVGLQLLNNPSIMFLDEPTSGLDAFAAQSVIKQLVQVASQGRTLIATLHQPRSSILELFPQVLFLTDGNVAYFGRLADASQYFTTAGFPCPFGYSIGDHIVDVISIDYKSPNKEKESRQRIELFAEANKLINALNPVSKTATIPLVPSGKCTCSESQKCSGGEAGDAPCQFCAHNTVNVFEDTGVVNVFKQFVLFLQRAFAIERRSIVVTYGSVLLHIVVGSTIAILFSNTNANQHGVQNLHSLAFVLPAVAQFVWPPVLTNALLIDKQIVRRERLSTPYSLTTFIIARTIANIPVVFACQLVFLIIVYWSVGLQSKHFGTTLLLTLLNALYIQSFSFAVSAICPNGHFVRQLLPLPMGINFIYSGKLAQLDSIPAVVRWLQYFSSIRWTMTGFAALHIRDLTDVECDQGKAEMLCLKDGHQALEHFGYDPSFSVWWCVLAMAVLYLLGVVLSILGMLISFISRSLPLETEGNNGGWLGFLRFGESPGDIVSVSNPLGELEVGNGAHVTIPAAALRGVLGSDPENSSAMPSGSVTTSASNASSPNYAQQVGKLFTDGS